MRIEDITVDNIKKVAKTELHKLRLSAIQVFDRNSAATFFSKEEFLSLYDILEKEMRERKLTVVTKSIDKELYHYRMVKKQLPAIEKDDFRFIGKKEDEQIMYGIVYEPNEEDTQGDFANEEEIRKAAYTFAENGYKMKLNHKGSPVETIVLETYIAPEEMTIEGNEIKKGTWLMAVKIEDEEIWELVKSGELTGFSMAGTSGIKE